MPGARDPACRRCSRHAAQARCAYHAIRRALPTAFRRNDFRVVHISLQRGHVHLVAEAANDWRHHQEDRGIDTMFWAVDWYSSGPTFTGWNERAPPLPAGYEPLVTSPPQTWMLSVGWRRSGTISMHAIPGLDCDEA